MAKRIIHRKYIFELEDIKTAMCDLAIKNSYAVSGMGNANMKIETNRIYMEWTEEIDN